MLDIRDITHDVLLHSIYIYIYIYIYPSITENPLKKGLNFAETHTHTHTQTYTSFR